MSLYAAIPIKAGGRRFSALNILLVATIIFVSTALGCLLWGAYQWHLNEEIKELKSNKDLVVSTESHPKVLAARIEFLLNHDRVDEAQPFAEVLDKTGTIVDRATAHYNIANVRLRQAFDLLSSNKLDNAGSYVILARQEYRKALTLKPDYWDAKYNLDVASRLIRDFPVFERTTGDTLNIDRAKIWTDIPGKPEGLP